MIDWIVMVIIGVLMLGFIVISLIKRAQSQRRLQDMLDRNTESFGRLLAILTQHQSLFTRSFNSMSMTELPSVESQEVYIRLQDFWHADSADSQPSFESDQVAYWAPRPAAAISQ